MSQNKSKVLNFRLKPCDKLLLQEIADKEDLKLSELIREILFKRIQKEKRKLVG